MISFHLITVTAAVTLFFCSCEQPRNTHQNQQNTYSITGLQDYSSETVESLKVTVLSTMVTDFRGLGEWGFAALVEAGEQKILFDTGARPNTVLNNAEELGIDLSEVTDVFISHHHLDHTGGLITLRKELMRKNPDALKRAHVAPSVFRSRLYNETERNPMIAFKKEYEALGGSFVMHEEASEIFPGIWTTGPVNRYYDEKNWSSRGRMVIDGEHVPDYIPEDQSLIIDTPKGLVLVAGCGHAGIINTLKQSRDQIRNDSIHAAIGGFHLFRAEEEQLDWTGNMLKDFGLGHMIGAHCTGIEALYKLRKSTGLDRKTAVVGAVGQTFILGKGIDAGYIAK